MHLAALDLGSNSFHLLVARVEADGELVKLGSQKDVLQLGSVVRDHGRLTPQAFEDALASVSRLATFAAQHQASKLIAVGTSALRDAENGTAFVEACRQRLGVWVELLTGDEEARLAYRGARSALPLTAGRVLLADIGGGSVELACGAGAECDAVRSLPLGFLRLAQAFPVRDVHSSRRLSRHVQYECEKVRSGLDPFDALVLSGGTARALGKLLGGGVASVSDSQVVRLAEDISRASPRQLRALGVDSDRIATLPGGAAIAAGVMAGFGSWDLRISPRGLREGLLLRELALEARHRAA